MSHGWDPPGWLSEVPKDERKRVRERLHALDEKRDSTIEAAKEAFREKRARLNRDHSQKVAAIKGRWQPKDAQKLDDAGVDHIAGWEGLRLTAYQDVVGVWTIGYGHTGAAARPGNTITKAEALRLLARDVSWAEEAVREFITVPLNQKQFNVLVSFTFNCGAGALRDSTLRRELNARRYHAVPAQLMRWVNGPNGPIQGLVNRRRAEARIWRKSL